MDIMVANYYLQLTKMLILRLFEYPELDNICINTCEIFNVKTLKYRGKPFFTLAEDIKSTYSKSNYKRVTPHSHSSFSYNLTTLIGDISYPLNCKKIKGEDEFRDLNRDAGLAKIEGLDSEYLSGKEQGG
ncbi:hypothetical protein CR513_39055, partial [Mucuna pruriens]